MNDFYEEEQRLWIIPGIGLEHLGLNDGEPIYYEGGIGNRDHRILAEDFCKKHNLDERFCVTHESLAKYFTSLGMVVLFNNQKISGKRAASIFLPSKLTEEQLNFFLQRRELFKTYYHESISFFEAAFWPEGDLGYKTTSGFRDLRIESIIKGKRTDNGQELFFRELVRQKEALIKHENKI